jgi:enoyl-CoA hydratase/carnithine racemase
MADDAAAPLVLLDRPLDGVARLTLNRPEKRNALSVALRDAVSDTLDHLASDETVKAVVVTGAGPTFCAGFDLQEFERAAADGTFAGELWASSDRYHHTLWTFPVVTIAAIDGPAVAGGLDLAVLCDLRIASTTARFSHPEYTFGDVVYGPLADLVGGAVARELCMTGRELGASDALAVHLVGEVVAPAELEAASLALAERVTRAPRSTLARTKAKALRRAGAPPPEGRPLPTLDL